MSSINTNLSAMTALQALKATQTALNKNQTQVSTGLRVGEASDNASYWSISTKMKSDNGALSAVKDSIKQSKAMIDTYTSALDKTLTYLNKIKTGLVAAKQPGADLAKIQTEFKTNIAGLKSAAESATFNGQNWLNATTSTSGTTSVDLVTSYDGENKAIKTLNVDITKVRLFDALTPANGILDDVSKVDLTQLKTASSVTFSSASLAGLVAGDELTLQMTDGTNTYDLSFTAPGGIAANDKVAFANSINNSDAMKNFVEASVDTNGNLVLKSKVVGLNFAGASGDGTNTLEAGGVAQNSSAQASWGAGIGTIDSFLTDVDDAINKVTTGSAMLGANKALLENQEEFISTLSDSLTAGVSAFIDADMNEVSTRNQALQTQQQLGVQALSMANQNSQMILKLFQ
ncbi:MAG TPA: flagellin [Microvirga sp.]|nr:flagellin [Microvirga sp.]